MKSEFIEFIEMHLNSKVRFLRARGGWILLLFLWMLGQYFFFQMNERYLEGTKETSAARDEDQAKVFDSIFELGKSSLQSNTSKILSLVKKHLLFPPSLEPYKLMENIPVNLAYIQYKRAYPSWIFIHSVLQDLFGDMKKGFFVEAGALDGEYLSNTLSLEKKQHWTGLLVEGDPRNYKNLREKHRKAWTTPVCLATEPFPIRAILSTTDKKNDKKWSGRGSSKINKLQNISSLLSTNDGYRSFESVICIPTKLLLEALNIHHIDFFSLDVEGAELDILKTFPFEDVKVDVWAIEHTISEETFLRQMDQNDTKNVLYKNEDDQFISFMENKGYYLFDMFCQIISDYIFLRIDSDIFRSLEVPRRYWKRRGICLKKKEWNAKKMTTDLKYLRDKRHWPYLKFRH